MTASRQASVHNRLEGFDMKISKVTEGEMLRVSPEGWPDIAGAPEAAGFRDMLPNG